MNLNQFVVNIKGDYVDSYIYSGYLFLVDSEYIINIYKWQDIFDKSKLSDDVYQSVSLMNLLGDSRKSIPKTGLREIELSREDLNKAKRFSFKIGVWPTDINVYSNTLYISSENGIVRLDLDYVSGELSHEIKLFDEMCFSISPNSHGRLAFSAGKSGVFTLVPLSKFHSDKYIKCLISEICVDIDWQSTKLFANTNEGVVEALYNHMPERNDFESTKSYLEAVKSTKSLPPVISRKEGFNFSWIAGDKTYSFDRKNGFIDIDESIEKLNFRKDVKIKNNILRVRTAAFGTIIETDDALVALVGDEEINIANNPVSWRVFPRAKNYANQLHIINDNHISITIVASRENNVFGFDTEKIDTRG